MHADDVAGGQQFVLADDRETVDLGGALRDHHIADLGLESKTAGLVGAGVSDRAEAQHAEGLVDELMDRHRRGEVHGGLAGQRIQGGQVAGDGQRQRDRMIGH